MVHRPRRHNIIPQPGPYCRLARLWRGAVRRASRVFETRPCRAQVAIPPSSPVVTLSLSKGLGRAPSVRLVPCSRGRRPRSGPRSYCFYSYFVMLSLSKHLAHVFLCPTRNAPITDPPLPPAPKGNRSAAFCLPHHNHRLHRGDIESWSDRRCSRASVKRGLSVVVVGLPRILFRARRSVLSFSPAVTLSPSKGLSHVFANPTHIAPIADPLLSSAPKGNRSPRLLVKPAPDAHQIPNCIMNRSR
jgi:hypothetical protein